MPDFLIPGQIGPSKEQSFPSYKNRARKIQQKFRTSLEMFSIFKILPTIQEVDVPFNMPELSYLSPFQEKCNSSNIGSYNDFDTSSDADIDSDSDSDK